MLIKKTNTMVRNSATPLELRGCNVILNYIYSKLVVQIQKPSLFSTFATRHALSSSMHTLSHSNKIIIAGVSIQ